MNKEMKLYLTRDASGRDVCDMHYLEEAPKMNSVKCYPCGNFLTFRDRKSITIITANIPIQPGECVEITIVKV